MLMCMFLVHVAHETAGAARIRHSLRPLNSEGETIWKTSGALRRENAKVCPPSLRGALATKQSIYPLRRAMDCFAALAMTRRSRGVLDRPLSRVTTVEYVVPSIPFIASTAG